MKNFAWMHLKSIIIFLLLLTAITNIFAATHTVTVNLIVSYKTVNFAGEAIKAIAVNDQIPGPTLHFKEGDDVTINVYNHLDKGTTIHWHGLLVPWTMDGVEGVSQNAIPPGGVFHYHFTLKQSGTYWYHAHAGFQEQQGLYGALIIDPLHSPHYRYNKDYVIVLSDWSNTSPNQIYANLKKDGDYYSPRFPLQPSLIHFIHDYRQATPAAKQQLVSDYKMMQQMRMSIYDITDVAYDAFLLNGHPATQPWTAPVKAGDVVRLRFIGAAGDTIFHVKIPGTPMQLVHVQGHDVQPETINDFTIAPGETDDVLIKIQKKSPYIIYAESADTLGAAYGALITNPTQTVDYQSVAPFPEPAPVTMMGNNMNMSEMKMPGMAMSGMTGHASNAMTMNAAANSMKMPAGASHSMMSSMSQNKQAATPTETFKTTGTKYQNLKAIVPTNNPNEPVQMIKMVLSGYMDRYIWFINGVPGYKAKPIMIQPGKWYRIVFINDSMMHHPMHLHGHFFILRNGHGAYDPLLHTIDVPPGATVVADFDADATGQWFSHCHLLYHMMAGMSRVFRYTTLDENQNNNAEKNLTNANNKQAKLHNQENTYDAAQDNIQNIINHPMAHPAEIFFANFLEVEEDPYHNIQTASYLGLFGADYNKLELYTEDAEMDQGTVTNTDMDIFYWHLLSQFWAIKGGINYFYRPTQQTPYLQPGIGIEGLMPYFIATNIRAYLHDGSGKLDIQLSRDTQIANRFFIRTGIRSILATKTVAADEIGSGLNQMRYIIRPYYELTPAVTVFTEYEHQTDYGAFQSVEQKNGEATHEDTISLGFAFLF